MDGVNKELDILTDLLENEAEIVSQSLPKRQSRSKTRKSTENSENFKPGKQAREKRGSSGDLGKGMRERNSGVSSSELEIVGYKSPRASRKRMLNVGDMENVRLSAPENRVSMSTNTDGNKKDTSEGMCNVLTTRNANNSGNLELDKDIENTGTTKNMEMKIESESQQSKEPSLESMTEFLYVCRENTGCNISFTHYNRLLHHYVNVHPRSQLPTFEEFHPELSFEHFCRVCSLGFPDFASLIRHHRQTHQAENKPQSEEFSLPFLADYMPPKNHPSKRLPNEKRPVLNDSEILKGSKIKDANRRRSSSCRSSPRSSPRVGAASDSNAKEQSDSRKIQSAKKGKKCSTNESVDASKSGRMASTGSPKGISDDQRSMKFTIQSQEENPPQESNETIVLSKETVDYLFSTGALKSDNLRSRSLDRITLNMAWDKLCSPETTGSPSKVNQSNSGIIPQANSRASVDGNGGQDYEKETNCNESNNQGECNQDKSGCLPKDISPARLTSKISNPRKSGIKNSLLMKNTSPNETKLGRKGQKFSGKRKRSQSDQKASPDSKRILRKRIVKKVGSESDILDFSDEIITDSDDENWSPDRKKTKIPKVSGSDKISTLRRKTLALGELKSKGLCFKSKKKNLGQKSLHIKNDSPNTEGQTPKSSEKYQDQQKRPTPCDLPTSDNCRVPNDLSAPADLPAPIDLSAPTDLAAPDDLSAPDNLSDPGEDIDSADVFECHLCHKTFNHLDRMTIHYR